MKYKYIVMHNLIVLSNLLGRGNNSQKIKIHLKSQFQPILYFPGCWSWWCWCQNAILQLTQPSLENFYYFTIYRLLLILAERKKSPETGTFNDKRFHVVSKCVNMFTCFNLGQKKIGLMILQSFNKNILIIKEPKNITGREDKST